LQDKLFVNLMSVFVDRESVTREWHINVSVWRWHQTMTMQRRTITSEC